jgi:hypothetical protein
MEQIMKSDIIDKVVSEFGTFTILVHRFLKDMNSRSLTKDEHDSFMALCNHMEQQTLPVLENLVKTRQDPFDLEEKVKLLEARIVHLERSKKGW